MTDTESAKYRAEAMSWVMYCHLLTHPKIGQEVEHSHPNGDVEHRYRLIGEKDRWLHG